MNWRTVESTWYEAVMVGGYGCKLYGQYDNKRDAQNAINESNERVVARGYKANKYYIVKCSCARTTEDNGDLVSETITRVKV